MKVISRGKSTESVPTRRTVSRQSSHAEHPKHKPLPFLASPVDPEALKWVAKKKRSGTGVQRATTVAAFDADQSESSYAQRIFRKQHEASTLELFFDLFFVANLAVFTTKSAHVDLQCQYSQIRHSPCSLLTYMNSILELLRLLLNSMDDMVSRVHARCSVLRRQCLHQNMQVRGYGRHGLIRRLDSALRCHSFWWQHSVIPGHCNPHVRSTNILGLEVWRGAVLCSSFR